MVSVFVFLYWNYEDNNILVFENTETVCIVVFEISLQKNKTRLKMNLQVIDLQTVDYVVIEYNSHVF